MGLQITAYRKIVPVRKATGGDDDYGDGLVRLYVNQDFPNAADGLEDAMLYSFAEDFDFRAGSYGGYNAWRAWLASLVGTTPERVWEAAAPKPMPFLELINFSDCEGLIGPKTAAKLAKDFAEYDAHAKAADHDDYYYDRYQAWRKAFEMAADDGAVAFH